MTEWIAVTDDASWERAVEHDRMQAEIDDLKEQLSPINEMTAAWLLVAQLITKGYHFSLCWFGVWEAEFSMLGENVGSGKQYGITVADAIKLAAQRALESEK